MIQVTHLGGKPFYLNSDLIESLEALPDTTLVLTSGKRLIVAERPDEIIRRIVEFRRSIFYQYPDERQSIPQEDRYSPRAGMTGAAP